MKALITGASSGIGRDMAIYLSKLGYNIIAVSRDEKKLDDLKNKINTQFRKIALDLSKEENCYKLYEEVKGEKIDILINNAGFGVFGNFVDTDLEKEINLIDTNIKAVHILTKLFLKDFVNRDYGNILNVASIAGFMPGPLMAAYYASKAYVLNLSKAIYKELRKKKSKVRISILCPGPVKTNFQNVANVKFTVNSLSSDYVAKYAIDKMLKNKLVIIPGISIKISKILTKISPDKIVLEIAYYLQRRKNK